MRLQFKSPFNWSASQGSHSSFRNATFLVGGFLSVFCFAASGWGQQVPTEPTSTHIFPAGGRRGEVVAVRVGGEFLPPYTRFRLVNQGVSAPSELVEKVAPNFEPSPRRKPGGTPITYPREWKTEIKIAADAPLGQVLWRVSSARGGSGGRPFIVGDLPEYIETESNSIPEKAELVRLPVTINGQIAGERDFDYFEFDATAGEVVSIDVAAARLGSPLDPVVELYDAAGTRQAVQEVRVGSDPVLAFHVPSTGRFRLLVANLNFHGGPHYVYRITLSTRPYALFANPSGALRGASITSELFLLTGESSFTRVAKQIEVRSDAPSEFPWRDATLANSVCIEPTDLSTAIEVEPNQSLNQATAVKFPSAIYGRFSGGNQDDDWYSFPAMKDQAVTVECVATPRGLGTLPVLTICTAQGAPLARASAAELNPRACRVEWRSPADGTYLLRVQDLHQGNGEYPYRVDLKPARPDFSITATADISNVLQGGRGELDLRIDRQGGAAGPIDLQVGGLPEGVKAEPLQIPAGVETFKLAFVASDDARPADSTVTITGVAKFGEETLTRTASAVHLGRDVEGVSLGSPTIDHVQLTVRHKQVFRLYCSEAYQYAHRGTIYPYLMEVERMNGFDGEIKLEMGDRQIMDLDGVEIVNTSLAAGQSQFMLPLYLPETMHINVQPHSNVYAQGYVVFQDKWGQRQSMLQVSEMRCMIRPLPTVAKLRVREKSISIKPGMTATCTLEIDRTSNFQGGMVIELATAPDGVKAERISIAADQQSATATISVDASFRPTDSMQLQFRGTGELSGGARVVSEALVAVTKNGN